MEKLLDVKDLKTMIIGKWMNEKGEALEFMTDGDVIWADGKIAKFEIEYQGDKPQEKDRFFVLKLKFEADTDQVMVMEYKIIFEGKNNLSLTRMKADGTFGEEKVYKRVVE